MKKIDLGQSAAIFANLGVIAGIVFLGFELRQNTSALESTANQAISDQMQSAVASVDGATLELVFRSEISPASLTPIERTHVAYLYSATYIFYQNLYIQVQSAVLDEAIAAGWWQNLRQLLELRAARSVWEQQGYLLSEDFKEFVEEEVLTLEYMEGASPWALKIE